MPDTIQMELAQLDHPELKMSKMCWNFAVFAIACLFDINWTFSQPRVICLALFVLQYSGISRNKPKHIVLKNLKFHFFRLDIQLGGRGPLKYMFVYPNTLLYIGQYIRYLWIKCSGLSKCRF